MARTFVLGPNAARELKRLIRGTGGTSRRVVSPDALAFDAEYAPPFTVQWAASANDGEGSWIIWLPGDELFVADGTAVDVAADLDDAGGDYPEGWYVLSGEDLDLDAGGSLYMNVDPGGDPEVAFANTADTSVFAAVKICEIEIDSTTGARSVRQSVMSALHYSTSLPPSPFRYAKRESNGDIVHEVVDCKFYWDGVLQELEDYDVTDLMDSGTLYLCGVLPAPGGESDPVWEWTLSDEPEDDQAGAKVRNFRLYDFEDGMVSMDWRTTFLAIESGGEAFDPSLFTVNAALTLSRTSGGGIVNAPLSVTITLSYAQTLVSEATDSVDLAPIISQMISDAGGGGGSGDSGPHVILHPYTGVSIEDLEHRPVQTTGSGGGEFFIKNDGITGTNGLKGDIQIAGGSKIDVKVDGTTIRISYNDGKPEDEGVSPGGNCDDHPGGGDGVTVDDDAGFGGDCVGGGGWTPGWGGVAAGGGGNFGGASCDCD